jgi:hypothetical protein
VLIAHKIVEYKAEAMGKFIKTEAYDLPHAFCRSSKNPSNGWFQLYQCLVFFRPEKKHLRSDILQINPDPTEQIRAEKCSYDQSPEDLHGLTSVESSDT